METKQYCEPIECELVGVDGNAYALMGHWSKCARRAGVPKDCIDKVLSEAMSGDYNHLLCTLSNHSKYPDDEIDMDEDEY